MRGSVCSWLGVLALTCILRASDEPDWLTRLSTVQQLLDSGRIAEAEHSYRGVLKSARAGDLRIAVMNNVMGVALMDQGRYREADALISDSVAMLSKMAPEDPRVARTWVHLAEIRWAQRRLGEAQSLCERALDVQKRTLGTSDPEVITTLQNLAMIHREQGHDGPARKYAEEALAALVNGRPARQWQTATLLSVARLHLAAGKPKAARKELLRALGGLERAAPPERREMAHVLSSLGALEVHLKHYQRAGLWLERAARLVASEFGPRHTMYAEVLVDRASVQERLGDENMAEQSLRSAVAIQTDRLGPTSPAVAHTILKHAVVLAKLGRKSEAQELEDAARSILDREATELWKVSLAELKRQ